MPDHTGIIWIATDAGLVHFNGRRFTNRSQGLGSLYIRALLPTPDGRYLFSSDAGVSEITSRNGTYHFPTVIPGAVVTGDTTLLYPNALFADDNGPLWISQPNAAIARWNDQGLQFYPFPKATASGASDSGFTFAQDRFGTIWAASMTGYLFAYDPEADVFVQKGRFDPILELMAEGDSLWVAGEDLHLLWVNDEREICDQRLFSTNNRVITCLARDPDGMLYAGTNGNGLFRAAFNRGTLDLQEVFGSNDPQRVDRLPLQDINDIFIDTMGAIWLSTDQGLGLLTPRFFEAANGVSFNNTTIVAPIRGQVYVSFGHVYEIERRGPEFHGRLLPGLERGSVNSMAATSRHCWMSTTNGRIFTYQNGKIANVRDLTGRGGGIFSLMADRKDYLWFCQAPTDNPILGLACITPDMKMKTYGAKEGLDNRILTIRESVQGVLYAAGIGEETYLYRFDPENDHFINLSLPLTFPHSTMFEVHDMAIDRRGTVWLATTDGLLRFDLERVQRIDLGPEFTDKEIRSVVAMPDGSLWLATDTYGLLYYKDGHYVLVDESSGLPSKVAAYRCLVRDEDGYLWVGTAEGVVHSFSPDPRPLPSVTPVFLKKTINGKPRAEEADDLVLPNRPDIQLRFLSIAYPGAGTEYKYRILGTPDSSWSVPSTDNELLISKPKPGQYLLEIKARQSGGYDWSLPLRWHYVVKKAWYATPVAIGLMVMVGLLGLWFLFRLRLNHMRNHVRSLEQLLAVRDEAIRQKEDQLEQQSTAATILQRQVARPFSNLAILHRVIRGLPRDADLDTIIRTLATAIQQPVDLTAFELAYYEQEALHFRGFSKRAESFTRRSGPFDENKNLVAWAMAGNETLLIKDFRRERERYIEPTGSYLYSSMVLAPFELRSGKRWVFCLYHLRKAAFDEHDVMAVQLLTDYLSFLLEEKSKS